MNALELRNNGENSESDYLEWQVDFYASEGITATLPMWFDEQPI
jgi:hypothetical protein